MSDKKRHSWTKFQLEHYQKKMGRIFDPKIDQAQLLVRQHITRATDLAAAKLAKKMGADKYIKALKDVEEQYQKVQDSCKVFFQKAAAGDEKKQDTLSGSFSGRSYYRDDNITVKDCEDQIRTWAEGLAEIEITKTPEGTALERLKQIKQKAIDTVFESGCPEDLNKKLSNLTEKVGVAWDQDIKALPNAN